MDKIKMGKFLTQLRNDKNLRQQDEAEIFQVSPQAISKWESGDSVPDIGTLEKLSNFYKVGIDEIINGEVKNPNANVSTVVVAKNPTMEERGIGKPYYGAFIFSMSAIFLALIFFHFALFGDSAESRGHLPHRFRKHVSDAFRDDWPLYGFHLVCYLNVLCFSLDEHRPLAFAEKSPCLLALGFLAFPGECGSQRDSFYPSSRLDDQ
jgi:Predicted transcriptional regulators